MKFERGNIMRGKDKEVLTESTIQNSTDTPISIREARMACRALEEKLNTLADKWIEKVLETYYP